VTGAADATRASFVPALARAATEADGSPPFSDQALVDVRSGAATVVGDAHAAAVLRDGEAELVVHPDDRRQGRGAELLQRLVDETEGPLLLWAHGDHPGSRVLAVRFGLAETRRLVQQRADVPAAPPEPRLRDGDRVASFRPGIDDQAWLDLNARAFADHPEQGSLVQADLDARKAEPWFDAGDFVLIWRGDELLAFCWLKLDENQPGEFYAVGVSPDHQGEGLGGAVVDAGFARLAERRAGTAGLYVEGDNTAALRLYAARGFTDHAVDVQYTLTR